MGIFEVVIFVIGLSHPQKVEDTIVARVAAGHEPVACVLEFSGVGMDDLPADLFCVDAHGHEVVDRIFTSPDQLNWGT